MTEAFWWYLLAGLIIGFTLSTLWEWLYFRRRRMRIENRRIAELEAMLRSYAAAEEVQAAPAGQRDLWAAPPFEDPGAYLDIEDAAAVSAAPPADLPPVSHSTRSIPPQVNGNSSAPAPVPQPPSPQPDTRIEKPVAAATVATAGLVAASRTQSTEPANYPAPPVQTYVAPRTGTFPTAAAQSAPPQRYAAAQPQPAAHTIPEGVTSHYSLREPAKTEFPSTAAQPAASHDTVAAIEKPSEPQPATHDEPPTAAIAGAAAATTAVAATRTQADDSNVQPQTTALAITDDAATRTVTAEPVTPAPAAQAEEKPAAAESPVEQPSDAPSEAQSATIVDTATRTVAAEPVTPAPAAQPEGNPAAAESSVEQPGEAPSAAQPAASGDMATRTAAAVSVVEPSPSTEPATAGQGAESQATLDSDATPASQSAASDVTANRPAPGETGKIGTAAGSQPSRGEPTHEGNASSPPARSESAAPPARGETEPETPATSWPVGSQAADIESQPADSGNDRRGAGVAVATVAAVAAKDRLDEGQTSKAEPANTNGYHDEREIHTSGTPAGNDAQANGVTAAPADVGAKSSSALPVDTPITPEKIDALVASIHDLIEAVNQDRSTNAAETAALLAAANQLQEGNQTRAEATQLEELVERKTTIEQPLNQEAETSSKMEEAFVLLVRSIARFVRQVRSLFSGEDGQVPQILRSVTESDLLRIDGMTPQHFARLRVAGITSCAAMSRLSETEVRMLLLTPGEDPVPDYSAWVRQAGEIASAGERVLEQ